MPSSVEPQMRAWLHDALGRSVEIAEISPLVGGLSQAMFRLDLTGADVASVVMRRWPTNGERQRTSAHREANALTLLAGSRVGAPELIASDPEGDRTGRPTTLMSCLPGIGALDPDDTEQWVTQLAERLSLIHDQPQAPTLQPCGQFADMDDPARRAWLAGIPCGEAALALARTAVVPSRPVFAHGDYQHFNLLWTTGRLSGVVDWAGSGVADAGRDVGHCMLNLAVLYDPDRAQSFLEQYQSFTGTRVDPAWLLYELLDYSPAWPQFIPIQVAGRVPVNTIEMRSRVDDVVARVVQSAG